MKILLRIVLLFYPGAFYSVDLYFSGFFLHHILGFYTLFGFTSLETVQVHQLKHQYFLWYWLSTSQHPDRGTPLETIVFHYVFAFQEISFKTHSIFSICPTPDSRVNPPSYQKVLLLLHLFQTEAFWVWGFFIMCFIYHFSVIFLLLTWNSFSQMLKRNATLNHLN